MKILGVGLSKTGTTSLHSALEILGYRALHYCPERLAHVLDGTDPRPNFRVYDDVDAVTDLPAAYFYRELLAVYPDCRCILTLRDENAWWQSIARHFNDRRPLHHEADDPLGWRVRQLVYGSASAREYLFRKRYREHNEQVRLQIPPSQLLTLDITAGEGWELICPFLGVPIPEEPFPHQNRRAATSGWDQRARAIADVVPQGESLLLISDGWGGQDPIWLPDRRVIHCLEQEGRYWGAPPDDVTAVGALESARQAGVRYVAVLSVSFWWFDCYPRFHQYLLANGAVILRNDALIVFDLKTDPAPVTPVPRVDGKPVETTTAREPVPPAIANPAGAAGAPWIKTLVDRPDADRRKGAEGWDYIRLFRGETPCLAALTCHVSTLATAATPHPPHTHPDEEILIVLSGCLEVSLYGNPSADRAQTLRVPAGSLIYYAAAQRHTIRSVDETPARYLVYKWRGRGRQETALAMESGRFQFWPLHLVAKEPGWQRCRVLRGATETLDRLSIHLTQLAPGAGYAPHCDDYDVGILVLDGVVETLGTKVQSDHVIFLPAGSSHGMHNPGVAPARYLVVEFHCHSPARLK